MKPKNTEHLLNEITTELNKEQITNIKVILKTISKNDYDLIVLLNMKPLYDKKFNIRYIFIDDKTKDDIIYIKTKNKPYEEKINKQAKEFKNLYKKINSIIKPLLNKYEYNIISIEKPIKSFHNVYNFDKKQLEKVISGFNSDEIIYNISK